MDQTGTALDYRITIGHEIGGHLPSLLSRLKFRRVRRSTIIIWDAVGSEWLLRCCPENSAEIIFVRGEQYNVHPLTLVKTIMGLTRTKSAGRAYARALLSQANPAVVLTFMDNSNFHYYANQFPGARFIAVQNGRRFPLSPEDEPPLPRNSTFKSELFCFGELDELGYAELGISFAAIAQAGSLKNSIWTGLRARNDFVAQSGERVDVCLVSQFRESLPPDSTMRVDFERCLDLLSAYMLEFPERRVAVAMASASDNPDQFPAELAFLQGKLGDQVILCPKETENFSVYALTDAAEVVLASNSTAGIEALARGRRTLITGKMHRELFLESEEPPWVCDDTSQDSFNMKIETLLAIDDEAFWTPAVSRTVTLLMAGAPNSPAVELLSQEIRLTLSS